MAETSSVEILEVCKVVPAESYSHFSLPLTFLDRIWLRTNPTSRLFFYVLPEPNIEFSQIILPKLKNSLSLALKHYLPLAGTLTWPQDADTPVIQYSVGDSVSLTVAETNVDFHYLSGNSFRSSSELRSLLPEFPCSESQSPAMTLQITLFPDKGFSIGYVAHHAVMDGKATSMFIHSWAYICRKGEGSFLPPELIPCFDRAFVELQAELERMYPKGFEISADPQSKSLKTFDMKAPRDTMLGTFKLTRENIETMKKSVFNYWEEKDKLKATRRVSAFNVTSAYIVISLLRAKNVIVATAEKTFIGFSVDSRLRLDPPLPLTYFGNCIVVFGGGGDTKDLLAEDGFVNAVDVVSEALSSLNEGIVKVVEKITNMSSSIPKSFVAFTIGGSPRFELYKTDFGWGKPNKVEMISIDKGGAFYLSDDRDDSGGIEIGIALKNHETQAFASLFAKGLQVC